MDGKVYSNLSNKWMSTYLSDSGYWVLTINNKPQYTIEKVVNKSMTSEKDCVVE